MSAGNVLNAYVWRVRNEVLVRRTGRECIWLLAAARTPYKIATLDGFARHCHLSSTTTMSSPNSVRTYCMLVLLVF